MTRHSAMVPGGARMLAEEVPVALVFNGTTQAVMMASPADLQDFVAGFAISEGLAEAKELGEAEIIESAAGIEARLWLPEPRAEALAARRRASLGPVGCGLCGIDSLQAALRPLRPVTGGPNLTLSEARAALSGLRAHQPLHDATRAVHAAGFWRDGRVVMAREDVGRHNALDKLIGALIRAGEDPASGALVLTSRVSLDMVQKAVTAGFAILLAVSAPTAHALRLAGQAGLTVATGTGGPQVWTVGERIRDAG